MRSSRVANSRTIGRDTFPPLVTWGIRITGALAVLIGAFWLVAWFGGWAANWSAAGVITVKANTALCQMGAGLALLMLGPTVQSRRSRAAGAMLALLVLLISALTLGEHLFRYDFGIDQLLAVEAPGAAAVTSPNRMGPPSSAALVLLGAGLLALALKRREAAPYLGLIACAIILLPAIGYIDGIAGFYNRPRLTGIAWPSVVALFSLGVGLILARVDGGPASLLIRPDAGGRILRRMLPAVILLPLLLVFIRTQGQLRGLYDSTTGLGLLVLALIIAFSAILWRSASLLSQSAMLEEQARRAVRESEARYRDIVETANEGVWTVDASLTTTFVNQKMAEILGYAPHEMTGRSALDFMDEDGRTLAQTRLARGAQELGGSHEQRYLRKDGSSVWTFANVTPLVDRKGNFAGSIAMLTDITERKRTEAVLHAVDVERQQILQWTPFMFVRCTRELRFSYASLSYARLVGYAQEEIVGRRIVEILGEAAFQKIQPYLERVLQGETVQYEAEVPLQRGGLRFLSVDYVPEKDEQGRVVGFVASMVDITERKRAEVALRESEKRLGSELDAMTRLQKLGMLLVDEETLEQVLGEIVDAAIAVCKADFGNIQILDPGTSQLRIAAYRGFPRWWIDFWNETAGRHGVCGAALQARERVIVDDVEHSPIFTDARAIEAQLKAGVRAVQSTPLLSRSGKPVGMFSTHYRTKHRPDDRELRMLDLLARHAADIITRAQAEAALREANAALERKVQERTAELARRASQLRALAGKLTLSEQRERRRMAKVMHDHLQQILVAAKFRAAILGRGGDDLIRKGSEEIEDLLNESIRTSRSLTAQLSPPILHDAGLSEGLEWLARWMADRHGLLVELRVEADTSRLAEDARVLLFESARELLFNAVKHARVHAAVVDVRMIENDRLQVTVSDDGQGFDPAGVVVADEPQSGFGLFGIREQMELFGGQMEIDSAPGRGSRIILRIPVVSADEQAGPAAATPHVPVDERAALEPDSPRAQIPIRILLADDHIVMRQGLGQLLGQESDFAIVGEAADGEEAVELAGKLLPDVILMDMSMPKLSGLDATRIIHSDHPEIRILGLSMFEDAELAKDMRHSGAAGYLVKSGLPADLIAAIRSSMFAKSGQEPIILDHHCSQQEANQHGP